MAVESEELLKKYKDSVSKTRSRRSAMKTASTKKKKASRKVSRKIDFKQSGKDSGSGSDSSIMSLSDEDSSNAHKGGRYKAFVPPNSIGSFKGYKGGVQRAKAWLKSFRNLAIAAGWDSFDKTRTFGGYMVGAANSWHKQLSRETRRSWKATGSGFQRRVL